MIFAGENGNKKSRLRPKPTLPPGDDESALNVASTKNLDAYIRMPTKCYYKFQILSSRASMQNSQNKIEQFWR
ncbi:hypothetical protein C1H46_039541 [Malus baccata]|uniref:Uncharacterized protein n=1 Tax=Malus baccata TaxID=106549 RepID=A0A540KL27_MALBA|nr:hypothetical protein C1H46_039541 [Malus baccata]